MRFRRNRFFLGTLQVALAATVIYGCSDDDSGGIDGGTTGTAGKGASGGSTGVAGTIGAGGDNGSAATGGTTGATGGTNGTAATGNVEECPGLPFANTGSGGEPNPPAPEGGSGGVNGGGAPAGGADSEPPPAGGAPSTGSGGSPAEACVGVSYEAERIDVDMFIMMDASSSMGYEIAGTGMTRWEALTQAVQDFAELPQAADIGAGIGFLSISGFGDDNQDCDVSAYADPVVGIGPLADTAPDILAAMNDKTPAGYTPLVPALQGAIQYAKGWADDHPGIATVVVLVSDGFPTQCGGGPEGVANAAEEGYTTDPRIKTYVIGVGDVARFNLENYARAGGTVDPFLTDEANASESFVEALLNITDSEIACEYEIPDPPDEMTQVDFDKVQIVYTPQGGDPEEVPKVNSLGDCAMAENGGYYYDNSTAPTRIYVCPCTCARFQAGRVDVRLGCEPRIGIR